MREPLEEWGGSSRSSGLRPDLIVAICAGIALGRGSGTMEALAQATPAQIQAAIAEAFETMREQDRQLPLWA